MDFFSRSPEQTRRIGIRLGGALQPGDVICLQGDLGAGKTTLVQGIAQGWGSLDSVSSPTFIIVNVYRRGDEARLFHMDAYRLDSALEAEDLDLEAMLSQGPLLIEWPERMDGLVPPERLWIHLERSGGNLTRLSGRARCHCLESPGNARHPAEKTDRPPSESAVCGRPIPLPRLLRLAAMSLSRQTECRHSGSMCRQALRGHRTGFARARRNGRSS